MSVTGGSAGSSLDFREQCWRQRVLPGFSQAHRCEHATGCSITTGCEVFLILRRKKRIATALRSSTAAAFHGGFVGASKRKWCLFSLLSLTVLCSYNMWKWSPWKRLFIMGLSNKRTHCLEHLLALRFWTQGRSLVYCGTLLLLPSLLCRHRGGAWAESMPAGLSIPCTEITAFSFLHYYCSTSRFHVKLLLHLYNENGWVVSSQCQRSNPLKWSKLTFGTPACIILTGLAWIMRPL